LTPRNKEEHYDGEKNYENETNGVLSSKYKKSIMLYAIQKSGRFLGLDK
jgi:hypothetical protein